MTVRTILVFAAGVAAALVAITTLESAHADAPTTYTCTAVRIPITRGKKADDPESVVEQVLPAGYVPYGGGAGGNVYNGSGMTLPYVIACRSN